MFSNFTQRPDELDFWFRVDPKYAGLGDFQIKFLAQNAQELDYVIDPQTDFLSYPNQTFPIGTMAGQPSVKDILLGRLGNDASTPLTAPPSTWVHFTRDVTADWTAPMMFTTNSTCTPASPCMLPGFPLDEPFYRIEFDIIGFQNPQSGGFYGMTAWLDNVKLYEAISVQPDFQLSANTSLLIPAGTSANSSVSVSSKNNFTGTVSLSSSSPIQNITTSLNPINLYLSTGGTGFSTLAISVANSTTPGTYSVTLTGQSGALSHSLVLSVIVILPSQIVNRQGWSLIWQVSRDDGIVLNSVSLNGTALISDARLPGILSTYVNNTCGPFYEEALSSNLTPSQVRIESTFDGGFQITAPYFVPGEFFQQVWKFLPDGTFQGSLIIGHGGCAAPHFYEVRWRYDFDLAQDDVLLSFDGSSWGKVSQETQIQDVGQRDLSHFNSPWAVTGSGRSYFFSPMDSTPTAEPGKILAVLNRPNEIEATHNALFETPTEWVNSESLRGQDTSFWYVSKHFSPGPLNASFPEVVTGLEFHLQSPSNLPPIASFAYSPVFPCVGRPITFDAGSSYDPDGNITSYHWAFGDGTTAEGSEVVHTYPVIGTFGVTLTVVDSSNPPLFGVQSKTLVVTDCVLVAFFALVPTSPMVGTPATFNGTASGGTPPYSFSWGFGDGSTATGNPVAHTYQNNGTFSAKLTVTDSNSVIASSIRTISVLPRDIAPIARFTSSPASPSVQRLVFFDGTGSFDPDGFITGWDWSWGDAQTGFGPTTTHTYASPGNFTVTLTVTDDAGLTGTISMVVRVTSRPMHDVGITFVTLDQNQILAGQVINVHVGVVNNGLSTETVNVTVYYDSHVAAVLRAVVLPALNSSCNFCVGVSEVNVVWDTTGVLAGNYTLSATMLLASDPTPADNTFVDGMVEILPPPTIMVTPNSGSLGGQVVVKGSNFPPSQFGPAELEITFDNQLLGFTFPQNGSFTFTFNVPHADPAKLHHIHAVELFPLSLDVQADFTVLPEPTTLDLNISVSVGPIYFPEETATVYVQTSLNGQPVGNGVLLQLQLIRPDGSTVTLSAVSVSVGVYKATYAVPKTGSAGTYAVVATAHQSGQNAVAIGSFEVKSPWIASQSGRATTTGLALVGIFGVLALAWHQGYFRRRPEDASSSRTSLFRNRTSEL